MSEQLPESSSENAVPAIPPVSDITIESILGLAMATGSLPPQIDRPESTSSQQNQPVQSGTSPASGFHESTESSYIPGSNEVQAVSANSSNPVFFVDDSNTANEPSVAKSAYSEAPQPPVESHSRPLQWQTTAYQTYPDTGSAEPTYAAYDNDSDNKSEEQGGDQRGQGRSRRAYQPGRSISVSELKAPFSEFEEQEYDRFLRSEQEHVARGEWDKFPLGSRLFIGNLPTDSINKRQLFRIFSKFGELAQISIKQAYGFVQFLRAEDCARAIDSEQGTVVAGRKIHLEESKPQGAKRDKGDRDRYGDSSRSQRRSESPDGRGRNRQGRGGRASTQNRGGSYGGYLGRQEQENDYGDRYRRELSPQRGRIDRGYRERSPPSRYRRSPSPAEDWPLPRRRPDEIPECQILVTDRVDRNFVWYVRKAFEDRYVKIDVLDISSRLSMSSVIRQMIIEGVFAVVFLNMDLQNQAKLSLQVFEKTPGVSTVRFDEYMSIDIPLGAEIVVRTKQKLQPQPATAPAVPTNALAQYLLGAFTQQQQPVPGAYAGQVPPNNPYNMN
ncbi:hypothetical protein V1520DRAFT_338535 [Lipomyces starkeyi]|uniref:RRM domain-containing protein n=1 Tax=Lipomyces starkeyi NRRL Y-11557 TaxID=675824 RepID=A0A1E3PXL3_LIPST|nr:hypothetical protein LIPSTDRAFT_6169 [Lipomyces starkeyi NRRL Y-11557]